MACDPTTSIHDRRCLCPVGEYCVAYRNNVCDTSSQFSFKTFYSTLNLVSIWNLC